MQYQAIGGVRMRGRAVSLPLSGMNVATFFSLIGAERLVRTVGQIRYFFQ